MSESKFYKAQGSKTVHEVTDQGNKAKKAHRGTDMAMPSKDVGRVNRKTGTAGHGNTNQGAAPRASAKDGDGTDMEDGHMGTAMSDGPNNSVAKGPSFAKKFGASEMSQAFRRRAKASSYLGGGD
jgi:hypothetical protein